MLNITCFPKFADIASVSSINAGPNVTSSPSSRTEKKTTRMNEEKQLEAGESSSTSSKTVTLQTRLVINKGISILEFGLRFIAVFGTIGSALAMGTTQESVPSLAQFVLLKAKYTDLPTLTFFVVANSIAGAYLVLSLPVSIYHIIRTKSKTSRG
ncbi:PREDICTED: casparian strip membrane protein 6 isoform X1 [Tarenaya hassleriana]|uniref:casparian strip membrane protein 6 isoform X1 n=1 Tax=Tarenaya hassleriana TaxID=28532 RepID=UPI00053C7426|nr:PREDICTED: casparian strip membrane protein 6 isoform X1 [Tarenaya hassleriana]